MRHAKYAATRNFLFHNKTRTGQMLCSSIMRPDIKVGNIIPDYGSADGRHAGAIFIIGLNSNRERANSGLIITGEIRDKPLLLPDRRNHQ